jgi:hypothetical protein
VQMCCCLYKIFLVRFEEHICRYHRNQSGVPQFQGSLDASTNLLIGDKVKHGDSDVYGRQGEGLVTCSERKSAG